jgi:BirA family biotin operon repressor/biotin-[acetyl-CoA-carboxylase] ligase
MTHSTDLASHLADEAAERIRTRQLGRIIRSHATVSSTNELALEWAADGAPEGAVVYAEFQERGRGRMGRTWSARPGVNLTFSVVLRPPLPQDRLGLITLAAGLAVAEAVDAFADPVRTQIKWPNDVLLNGRKCCGMLLESSWSARRRAEGRWEGRAVVLGIGINVNQDAFSPELADHATSILLETGRPVSRPDLYAALLDKLEAALDLLAEDEAAVRGRYVARMRDLNEPIELRFAGRAGSIRGVAKGLTESGGLLLATNDGMRAYHAGEVTRSI